MMGKLVIISAPSGAGKTTIVKHLLNCNLNLEFSISATTRPKRVEETEGIDYYFFSINDFRKRIENGDFIEWEEVYKDHFYGTLKSEIERIWASGRHVLFDVDTKGGINLKKIYATDSIALFIMPPSIEELESRLTKRGTDMPAKIMMRVQKASEEIRFAGEFDYIVINQNLDRATSEVFNIVSSFINKK
jgi:guanylate kinase